MWSVFGTIINKLDTLIKKVDRVDAVNVKLTDIDTKIDTIEGYIITLCNDQLSMIGQLVEIQELLKPSVDPPEPPEEQSIFETDFSEGWQQRITDNIGGVSFLGSSNGKWDITDGILRCYVDGIETDQDARSQFTINPPEQEVYHFSMNYKIGKDFNLLNDYTGWMFFSLIELWDRRFDDNDNNAGQARWSLSLIKESGKALQWQCRGAKELKTGSDVLFDKRSDVKIPINEWFTIDFYFQRDEQGRMTIKINNEVLFDLIDVPTIYIGRYEPLQYCTPIKLYMFKDASNIVINKDGIVELFFANFKWF